MKLRKFSLPVSMAKLCLCLSIGAAVWASGEPVEKIQKPSWFKADKDGIYWFQQGDDDETKYSASLILSGVTDGIVITVTANEKHIDDAVKLAKKMRTVLEKSERTPDKVFIVASRDNLPGVGYRFYTDGLACGNDKLGKKGIYRPNEAKKALGYVVKHYRTLRDDFVANGKWGKDHAEWKILKVVEP